MTKETAMKALQQLEAQKNDKKLFNLLCYMVFLNPDFAADKKWLIELVELDPEGTDSVVEKLQNMYLIEKEEQEGIKISKLIQDDLMKKLINENKHTTILQILANYFYELKLKINSANVNDPKIQKVIFHIIAVLNHINTKSIEKAWEGNSGNLTSIINLLIVIAQFYMNKNDRSLIKAEEILDEAKRLQGYLTPHSDEVEAAITYERGNLYLSKAKIKREEGNKSESDNLYQNAKVLFQTAISSKKVNEHDMTDIAQSCQTVSYFMLIFNDYTDALQYSKDALDYFEKIYGEQASHTAIASTYHIRGSIYAAINNFKQAEYHLTIAENLYKQLAVEQERSTLARIKSELAIVKGGLAKAWLMKSKSLLEESLEIEKSFSSESNNSTVTGIKNTLISLDALLQQGFFDIRDSSSLTSQPPIDNAAQKSKPMPPVPPPKENRKRIPGVGFIQKLAKSTTTAESESAAKSTNRLPTQQMK